MNPNQWKCNDCLKCQISRVKEKGSQEYMRARARPLDQTGGKCIGSNHFLRHFKKNRFLWRQIGGGNIYIYIYVTSD